MQKIYAASALIALQVFLAGNSPAFAQLDPAQVEKRKLVIHSCLLKIYMDQKKRPAALAEFQALTGMTPNDPKLRYQYAAYLAAGNTPADFSAALTQMKKAVQLEPANGNYNGFLGSLYVKLKNTNEAEKWFKLAVQYGAAEYKKTYEEIWKFNQQKKLHDDAKKKLLQQKQQQQQTAPGAKPGGASKNDDDDDDW